MNKTNTTDNVDAAKQIIVLLKDKNGCSEFNELVNKIRNDVSDGVYAYEQIGVTEIELLELGLINARLKCVRNSSSIYTDQCVVQSYTRELVRLRPAVGKTKRVA